MAALAISTIITGIFFLLIGSFRLGNLIRFIPYPVMAGFLAGTGWLLVRGGMVVLTGAPLSFSALSGWAHTQRLFRWLPAVIGAVVALVAVRRWARPLIVPAAVIGGGLLFYVIHLLMSCSSIELGVGHDLDLNRELRVAGVANVLSGSAVGWSDTTRTASL